MLKNIVKDVKKAVARESVAHASRNAMVGRVLRVGEVEVRVEASLGEGGFACIYSVRDTQSRVAYALKHVRMSGDPELVEDVKTEVTHMQQLHGQPNVLALHAVSYTGPLVCVCVYLQQNVFCNMCAYTGPRGGGAVAARPVPLQPCTIPCQTRAPARRRGADNHAARLPRSSVDALPTHTTCTPVRANKL